MSSESYVGAESAGSERFATSTIVAALTAIAGGLTAWAVAEWTKNGAPLLASEHGILENIQQVTLAPIFVLFLDAFRKGHGAFRVSSGALALLSAAAFVREIEVKSIDGPVWYQWVSHHGLQEILFVVMSIPIPIYFFLQRRYFRQVLGLALRREAWPIYLGGLLLAASIVLDERVVHDAATRFWEEMLEVYGYGFLLLAAWRHHQLVTDPACNRA